MNWLESVQVLEELEDANLDAALIAQFEQAAVDRPVAPIRFLHRRSGITPVMN